MAESEEFNGTKIIFIGQSIRKLLMRTLQSTNYAANSDYSRPVDHFKTQKFSPVHNRNSAFQKETITALYLVTFYNAILTLAKLNTR